VKQRLVTWLKGVISFIRPIHLIALGGLIVFFWFLIMGDQGIYRLRQLLQLRTNLEAQHKQLARELDEKERERRMLEDPKRLEQIIRKELGYIKPGEVIFQEAEE
jgi:cell division protein FtsB